MFLSLANNNFVSSMDYCDQVKADLAETGIFVDQLAVKECDAKDACNR